MVHTFDQSFGAELVGVICTAALFGVMSLQTYLYFENYPRDGKWLKALVGAVWVLDLLQMMACSHFVYWYTVSNWGIPDGLNNVHWTGVAHIGLTAFIPFLVQLFFLRRVWILGRNIFIVAFIGVAASLGAGFGLANCVYVARHPHFSSLQGFDWGVDIWLICAPLADVCIAAFLVNALFKSRSGFSETIVKRLIVYTINTGLLTSVIAVLDLITFKTLPNGAVHLIFNFMLSKLYTNSLLASLNARSSLSGRGRTTDDGISLPVYRRTGTSRVVMGGQSKTAIDHITVDVTTTTTRDQTTVNDTGSKVNMDNDYKDSNMSETDVSFTKAKYGGEYIC
jgi:hypothetical protein